MFRSKTRALVAVALLGISVCAASVAHAGTEPSDKVLYDGFLFSSLSAESDLFPALKVQLATNALVAEVNKGARAFSTIGYADKRCTASNYPNMSNPCALTSYGWTRANQQLSQHRANTLMKAIKDKLPAGTPELDWQARGVGEKHAETSAPACRANPDGACKFDRHADLVITKGTMPSETTAPPTTAPPTTAPPTITAPITAAPVRNPPTPSNKSFNWTYGANSYVGNLATGDVCPDAPCSWSLVSQPSYGTVSVTTGGSFTYIPSASTPYWRDRTSFSYRMTTAYDKTADATVTIDIVDPAMPLPPLLTGAASLTAPSWARLNLAEKFSTKTQVACIGSGVAAVSATRCVADAKVVGSFIEITSVTVTDVQLTRPKGYPLTRFKLDATSSPVGKATPATGLMKFSQATTATGKFKLTVGVIVNYRQGEYRLDNDGTVQYSNVTNRVATTSVSSSLGVVGVTR